MTPILITAAQAQELHTTGRLTGYREKCEWQPNAVGDFTMEKSERGVENEYLFDGTFMVGMVGMVGMVADRTFSFVRELTPPRDTETAYAVKEACEPSELGHLNDRDPSRWDVGVYYHCDDKDKCRNYGCQETCFLWMECPKQAYDAIADSDDGDWLTADEMPDWAVRQHARITDIKLIIESGELWWDMDLEKVAKA